MTDDPSKKVLSAFRQQIQIGDEFRTVVIIAHADSFCTPVKFSSRTQIDQWGAIRIRLYARRFATPAGYFELSKTIRPMPVSFR